MIVSDPGPSVAVVDYGMGNIRSMATSLARAGARVRIAKSPAEIEGAAGLVLPGVGAFERGMRNLSEAGLLEPVVEFARSGRPFLAVCIGMQLLFEESEEGGFHKGLGVLPGRVVRLPEGQKIPEMGWNTIDRTEFAAGSPFSETLKDGEYFYFAHSYRAEAEDPADVVATTEYGVRYASAVGRGRLLGTQFHPEKSAGAGLDVLKRFVELAAGE